MENDIQVKYDSICYITFLNIKHLTEGATRIVLKNIDWKNLEHKFVVHIVNACYGILGEKEVAIEAGPFTRGTISRECRALGKIRKVRPEEEKFVDVVDLLEFMRGYACELCGEDFTFGEIYNKYYSGKEEE